MIKYIIYIISILAIVALAITAIHFYRVSARNKKEMKQYESEKVKVNKKFGKTLVIYYSLTGNTKEIAEKIKFKTNADIYEIKTAENLGTNPMMHLKIRKQLKNKQYPKLENSLPDLKKYDIIFVGSPVWWYTVSTPVLAFLENTDFHGKKVVPFSTQGSNKGKFLEDFKNNAKNAKILKYESFNNLPKKYDDSVDNKISKWLNGL